MIQITGDPSAERTAPPCSTHVRSGRRLLLLDPVRGEGEVERELQQHDGVVVELVVLRQSFATLNGGGGGVGGGGLRQGQGVKLPCAFPLYIGVERDGFLPSKSIWALAKVGGMKSHHFLPHRLLSPLFRDLDLIPSGYDLIPSKGESWCALNRGVGPCPHYPRSCGSPHAGGPHFGTF